MKTIGLIINPIAGMGGRVGLKGTDTPEILEEARKRGAKPVASERTRQFLVELIKFPEHKLISFVVPQGDMGGSVFKTISSSIPTLKWQEIPNISIPRESSRKDTCFVAEFLKNEKVDLLVFVGGDGTACDILQSVGSEFPILGIPSGVKMHSGVFSQGIEKGVEILCKFVRDEVHFIKSEVIDLDEEKFREDRILTKLYGLALVPQAPSLMQLTKTSSHYIDSERENMRGIIRSFKKTIDPNTLYLLGPGSTIKELSKAFNTSVYKQKTLLGIDAIQNSSLVEKDLSESDILRLIAEREAKSIRIVITPIGGQGYIFGRGNLQFSPYVILKIGLKQIDVVATKLKIENLPNKQLHVDSGDLNLDRKFSGYIKVLVDYEEFLMVKVV